MKTFKYSFFFILLTTLLVVTGCDKDCPEQDVDSLNAIYLQFKIGGTDGFTEEELESVILARFSDLELDSFRFPIDTFVYNTDTTSFYQSPYRIRLSKYLPQFENPGPPFYTAYKYVITNPDSAFVVTLQEIELEGGYDSENCIYTNSKKTFLLNGELIDVTASEEYVEITKP